MRNNGRKGKAIFACAAGISGASSTCPPATQEQVILNQRFHLKPLAAIFDGMQQACVALRRSHQGPGLRNRRGTIVEKLDFINELTRRGRSDGWGGYDAGHVERRVMNEVMQHFKIVSDAINDHVQGRRLREAAHRLPR